MDIKQQIHHHYRVDELSIREIARKTGADRKTISRLINAYEAAVKSNPDTGVDEFLVVRPNYKPRTYAPRVVRDAVSKEIDKWLKENERRRGNGMRKQCLKCKDIHRELLEKGLNILLYHYFCIIFLCTCIFYTKYLDGKFISHIFEV